MTTRKKTAPKAKKKAPKPRRAPLQLTPSGSLPKAQAWQIWGDLEPNQTLKPEPIPYGHTGSTIDEDGIRICGSREFVEAALSCLKGLRRFESYETRVGLSWQEITLRDSNTRAPGKFRVSIQVHQTAAGARVQADKVAKPKKAPAPRPAGYTLASARQAEVQTDDTLASAKNWALSLGALEKLGHKPGEAKRRLHIVWQRHGASAHTIDPGKLVAEALNVPAV